MLWLLLWLLLSFSFLIQRQRMHCIPKNVVRKYTVNADRLRQKVKSFSDTASECWSHEWMCMGAMQHFLGIWRTQLQALSLPDQQLFSRRIREAGQKPASCHIYLKPGFPKHIFELLVTGRAALELLAHFVLTVSSVMIDSNYGNSNFTFYSKVYVLFITVFDLQMFSSYWNCWHIFYAINCCAHQKLYLSIAFFNASFNPDLQLCQSLSFICYFVITLSQHL